MRILTMGRDVTYILFHFVSQEVTNSKVDPCAMYKIDFEGKLLVCNCLKHLRKES